MGSVERVPVRSAPLDPLSHRDAVVDVCLVDVDSPDWCDPLRPAGLSDDEKRRSEAFRFEQHRRRFIEETYLKAVSLGMNRALTALDVYGPTDQIEVPEAGSIGARIGVGHG